MMVSPGCSRPKNTAWLACEPELRLHVGELGAEQLLDAVDRQLLDHVDVLAAAVVALAGVALGVLVGQLAALGRHHRRRGVVLARRSARCALPGGGSRAWMAAQSLRVDRGRWWWAAVEHGRQSCWRASAPAMPRRGLPRRTADRRRRRARPAALPGGGPPRPRRTGRHRQSRSGESVADGAAPRSAEQRDLLGRTGASAPGAASVGDAPPGDGVGRASVGGVGHRRRTAAPAAARASARRPGAGCSARPAPCRRSRRRRQVGGADVVAQAGLEAAGAGDALLQHLHADAQVGHRVEGGVACRRRRSYLSLWTWS